MWCPPTPPQQENDVYIDNAVSFLYDTVVMSENQLPPIYVKKEAKRTRSEAGFSEGRRSMKIPKKEEVVNAPKSIFHPHALYKMRRDVKWQKYRNLIRPGISIAGKPTSNKIGDQPIFQEWTIHEDMALLKVVQSFQNLPINLMISSPAHTPNWDFVAEYVNTVSVTYRAPKQCRQRYDSVLMQREEGKQIYDQSMRKKKNKNTSPQKLVFQQQKSNRPMRTSQLYTQDNNSSFSQTITQKYDSSLANSTKPKPPDRTANNILPKNPKHIVVWNECGIDFDHPLLPTDVAVRRAERVAREKKMTTESRLQLIKGIVGQGQSSSANVVSAVATNVQTIAPTQTAGSGTPTIVTVTAATTGAAASSSAPNTIRGQRIIASPLQTSTVVSVANLSPAQLQAATQRLIVSANSAQAKSIVTAQGVQSRAISPAQLQMIRHAASLKQQVRLQTQGLKTSTVTIGGQATVVQFSQAQPRPQFVRQGTVAVGNKTAITRTESEVAQILKKQQQLQQQKALAAAVASQSNTIQSLSPQVFAHAFQQAGTSGTPVATLVKTVSSSGVSQAVTIPIASAKSLNPQLKTTPQQIRQLHIQQQLLAQKKLSGQKVSIAQVAGAKANMQTQLIVGSKPLQTAMTVQQFQQVIRSPMGVSQGPVVLAKGTPRVIPVNAGPGNKQTIQVVATSQGLASGLRPQTSSTLAGALAGLKVQGQTTAQTQQALLSQVSAALQNQSVGVRQGSPVRIQTSSGTPIVAVTVQSNSNMQGGQGVNPDQITRFMKK